MRPSLRTLVMLSCCTVVALVGCDDGSSTTDAGTDAGAPGVDAGRDASVGEDAGLDAGSGDSGVSTDGGVDGGSVDAGAVDAGCASPAQCPAPASECEVATCSAGACGTAPKATGTTCASSGGHLCDGAGACVACVQNADCPASANDCTAPTCQAGVCGTANKAAGASCATSGGRLCDGAGACVACLQNADGPATGTTCAAGLCSAGVCGTAFVAAGTSCNDHAGVVCDGAGTCSAMHCADGLMDADETDVDCGGSCGATCQSAGPQQKCRGGGDCLSGVCSGAPLLCQVPTCSDTVRNGSETDVDCGGGLCPSCGVGHVCRLNGDCGTNLCAGGTCASLAQGQACSSNAQCQTGQCVSGVCCGSACNGTCQACSFAQTGQPNGTCAAQFAGTPAPAGQCSPTTACGFTGTCGAGGTCAFANTATVCAAASCSGSTLTPSATCNGSGTCTPGTAMPCPGGLLCANATSCKTTCLTNADCQASTPTCNTTTHACGP